MRHLALATNYQSHSEICFRGDRPLAVQTDTSSHGPLSTQSVTPRSHIRLLQPPSASIRRILPCRLSHIEVGTIAREICHLV